MAVQYYLPGLGLYSFDDGTTPEQAFKLAGIDLPKPESKGAQLIPSLKRGVGGLAQGVGSAIKDVYPETGGALEEYGKGVVEANPAAYPSLSDIHGVGSALGYAGERVAEAAPLAVGGIAAGLAGGELAAGGLMAGAMGTQTYGDVREKQRETGQDNIPAALGAGTLAGALGVAGGAGGAIRGAFGKAAEETVQRNLLQSAGRSAAEQAAINPTVSAASRAASGESVSDSDALGEYANQAVSGGIVGGAFGAAMHPFQKKPVAETQNADLLKSGEADKGVNRDLNKDLFGNTPEDNLPIGPQAPEKTPAYTPGDLANLKGERSRLLRAAADADTREDYYKYLDAAGKVDQQLSHPGMQFLDRQLSGRQASADTGEQPSLFGAASPVKRPAPLALPRYAPNLPHDQPVLYADNQGNVANAPGAREAQMAAAPEGSQGNLFTPVPDKPQTPAPVQGSAQPAAPLTGAGQKSLFDYAPTSNLKNDFDRNKILQRLQTDVEPTPAYRKQINKLRADLSNMLTVAIHSDDPAEAHRALDAEHQDWQGRNIGKKNADAAESVFKAARDTVNDYSKKMSDAREYEAIDTDHQKALDQQAKEAQQRQTIEDMQAEQQQHQDKLAAVAKQHADAADQIAQANQTITDSHRNAIVQKAINDPNETNHAARVAETLKRNGLDPELRPHEQEAVDRAELLQRRRADATEAFSKPDMVEDNNPNQPIFEYSPVERSPRATPGEGNAPRESNTTRGYHASENFKLELQSEEAFQRLEDARKRREARTPQPEPTPTRNTRQGEMFTPTGKVKKAVDNRINRDPNAPENFKLTRQRPEDIREPAAQPEQGPDFTPSNRQGEMFTPTGRIKKSADQTLKNSPENFKLERPGPYDIHEPAAETPEVKQHLTSDKRQGEMFTPTGKVRRAVDQSPPKVEAPKPKPETKGERIKKAVAEKNAATRIRGTLKLKPKEEPNATEARPGPQGDREQHSGTREDRTPAEAGDRDRVEQSREVAPETESGEVTYESVLRNAERQLARDGESGLLKPKEYQQLSVLAEQKNVSPERLQEMLDKALDRNAQAAMREATGTATKRRAADEGETRPDFTWYEMGKATDQLQKRLNQLGLRDVALAISHNLLQMKDGPANAAYSPTRKLITVAMNAAKEMGKSLDHEVIHHLKNVGIITKPEFARLVDALRRNKELSARIDEAYKHLDQAGRDEELVAEGFARWANGDKSVFRAASIFDKIKSFFDAIRSAFTSQGFKAAEDIFKAIESGQIGARPRGGLERPAGVSPELTKARSAAIEKLPEELREPTQNVLDTLSNAVRRGAVKLAFTEDLALMSKKVMPAAEKYIKAMGVKMQTGRQFDDRITKTLDSFRSLDKKMQALGGDTVNGLIQSIDEAKAWPFEPEHLSHLASVPRADAELTARFDALPKEAQKIVKDVFRTNHEMLQSVKDIVHEISGEKGLAEFKTILGIDESQPYNSRRRHGDYVAFAKSKELKDAEANGDAKTVEKLRQDQDHYFVNMYDTFHQAQEAVRQLRDAGNYHDVLDARETDKAADQIVGARNMMLAFQQLRTYIKEQVPAGKVDEKTLDGITKLANELYLRSLRQSSSRKSEIRRLGVAGGDLDSMRNFITQSRAQAHFIASMKHSQEIFDTMSQMKKEAMNSPDPKAMSIYNEMMTRHVSGMSYKPSTLVNRLKGLTGTYMIVSSPAFYLEQGMQPWMLSAPLIGGRHGYRTAMGGMGEAFKEVGKMWGNPTEQFKLDDVGKAYKDKVLGADVKRAVDDLSKSGIIDVGLNNDLGTFQSDQNSTLGKTDNLVFGKFRELTRKIEAFNRLTTGIAAYKLERTKLMAEGKLTSDEIHNQAVDYAHGVIRDTHGSYDGFNAPMWMRGPTGSLLTQFRKFQLMQATLLAKMAHGSLKSLRREDFASDKEFEQAKDERYAMRRAAMFTVMHAGVMGGMAGLPAMGTLSWVMNNLFSTADEPFDVDERIRRAIGDDSQANLLLHGIPTLGKHGLDISERVGMGNAFSLFPFVKDEPGSSERKSYESLLAAAAGPALGSIGFQMADALDLFHKWEYQKGLEKLMPKGFSNIAKAYREQTQGVSNSKGDTLMSSEDVSFAQSLVTALGLKTSDVSERQEKSGYENEKSNFYKDRTARIVLEFTNARKAGDTAGMQDARERFMALQAAKWKEGLPRSPMSTLVSAAQNQRLRERSTVEGVTYKQRSPGLRRAREEALED